MFPDFTFGALNQANGTYNGRPVSSTNPRQPTRRSSSNNGSGLLCGMFAPQVRLAPRHSYYEAPVKTSSGGSHRSGRSNSGGSSRSAGGGGSHHSHSHSSSSRRSSSRKY